MRFYRMTVIKPGFYKTIPVSYPELIRQMDQMIRRWLSGMKELLMWEISE